MAQHLLPEDLLLDYAAGNLPEPLALLVATHLTLAPESRREVRELETIGGAFFETLEPEALSPTALDSVLDRLDAQAPEDAGEAGTDPILSVPARREAVGGKPNESHDGGREAAVPAPLRHYVRGGLHHVPWRSRGGSVSEFELLRDHPGYRTRLLRIRAGARVPMHTHEGREVTLVLEGSFSDVTGDYGRGDVAVADTEVTHQPVAGSERDCICLAVTDAPLKMTGPLGRVLNLFVDM